MFKSISDDSIRNICSFLTAKDIIHVCNTSKESRSIIDKIHNLNINKCYKLPSFICSGKNIMELNLTECHNITNISPLSNLKKTERVETR